MITRPLDLASRLRPEPRNFDALFFVNAGLLILFFGVFGSRFVLAPGLGVDFRLPTMAGANANAKAPTHAITVLNTGLILTSHGEQKLEALEAFFTEQAKTTKQPILLIRGDAGVPLALTAEISKAAKRAGFEMLWAAGDPLEPPQAGGR